MSYEAYKYTFKLHVAHNLTPSQGEKAHYHTIKIILYIKNENNKFSQYDETEKVINKYLNQYEKEYLNHTTLFQSCIPTIENIGRAFYDQLNHLVSQQGMSLIKLEISETPIRVFSISEKIWFT